MDWSKMTQCGNYNQASIKALKRRKAKQAKKNKVHPSKKIIKEYQADLKERITPAEAAFKRFLKSLQIEHEFQKVLRAKKKHYIVDFYLVKSHTVVEIDGDYHKEPGQRKKDKRRAWNLRSNIAVADVIRFTNKEVLSDNLYRLFLQRFCPFLDLSTQYHDN